MGIRKRHLPTADDLKYDGIAVVKKTNADGETENDLVKRRKAQVDKELQERGYPAMFPYSDQTFFKHLRYRILRFFLGVGIGLNLKTPKGKHHGAFFVLGLAILVTIIYLAVTKVAGALAIAGAMIGFFAGLFLSELIYRKVNLPVAQLTPAGVETPVSEHFENGERVVDYIKNKETTLQLYSIPEETTSRIWGNNVRTLHSGGRNNTEAYLVKHVVGNNMWGDESYADLMVDQLIFLSRPQDMYPAELDSALAKLRKMGKHVDNVEEIEQFIRDAYTYSEKWRRSVAEIQERVGKRIIRISPSTEAYLFLADWPERFEMVKQKLEALRVGLERNPDAELEPLNRAIEMTTEFSNISLRIKEAEMRGRNLGINQALEILGPQKNITEVLKNAGMSLIAENAKRTEQAINEINILKKIQGVSEEDDEQEEG